MVLFTDIKQFLAIKSSTKEGLIDGQRDMIKEGKVPLSPPFKHKKEWISIIVEYKKIVECQIN